ncbi:MAG: hypothetical protein LLF83_03875 [Methanobacterium sp.]|nr:hypothetical protein [Methanobacterium sp.]
MDLKLKFNINLIATYSILLVLILSTILISYILFNTFWGDPSIYLVYAKNIAAGEFFSFNPGDFSSGATSPLWAFILATGFLIGNGVLISKIISLFFVIIALLISYKASLTISKSKIGSAISVGFLWYFLAFSGIFIYESGLTVCLISILIIINYYIIKKGREKYIFYLGVIWSILPLVRPESMIITILNVLLLIYIHKQNFKTIYKIIGIFLISLIPIVSYFSYSYLKTGFLSTSTFGRSSSLRIISEYVSNASYNALFEFLTYPTVIMGFFIGTYGIIKEYKNNHWILFLFLTTSIAYFLIFMVYSPLNNPLDIQRYLIPVIPFLIPFISLGIMKFIKITNNFKIGTIIIVSLITLTLIIVPIVSFIVTYQELNEETLKFDDVTDKDMINYLNNYAEPNATVLAYEVQDRYYLRNDLKLLSMDGITDGKVIPYLFNHNITGFLWKYKPNYLIVNKAVYLPMYSNSIIRQVIDDIGNKEGESVKIDGIIFKNIKINNKPLNSEFWGYTEIYELKYQ